MTRSTRTPAAFITFYSFKGGVGRSMAVINVAVLLADHGFRVLVLDLDLEAPGISYLAVRPPRAIVPGFIELLGDAIERGESSDLFSLPPSEVIDRYTLEYDLRPARPEPPPGELHVMPAGRLDGAYQTKLDELDIPRLYRDGRGQPLVRAFKQILQESGRFDMILVDSRTGFSDEAGICTRDLADHLFVVSGLNHQNITGTTQFLRVFRSTATDSGRSPRIVHSPVPDGEEALTEQRIQHARDEFAQAWGAPLPEALAIHYHPRLALTEEPYIFHARSGRLYDEYLAIERSVLQVLGMSTSELVKRLTKALDQHDPRTAEQQLHMLTRLARAEELDLVLQLLAGRDLQAISDESLEKLAAQALPSSAGLHPLAIRLSEQRRSSAEALYRRALVGSPRDADILGNYALFMANVRNSADEAEGLFRRALEVDPRHAHHLGGYAFFMLKARRNVDDIEALLRRALAADPKHATVLGGYAVFMMDIREDPDAAETLFRNALESDPDNNNHIGNFAKLLLLTSRQEEGLAMLAHALAADAGDPALNCELQFYAYAHAWNEYPHALAELRRLLESGARSPGWRLDRNVERATQQGHPEPALLAALAEVITKDVPLKTLDPFEAWRQATQTRANA